MNHTASSLINHQLAELAIINQLSNHQFIINESIIYHQWNDQLIINEPSFIINQAINETIISPSLILLINHQSRPSYVHHLMSQPSLAACQVAILEVTHRRQRKLFRPGRVQVPEDLKVKAEVKARDGWYGWWVAGLMMVNTIDGWSFMMVNYCWW